MIPKGHLIRLNSNRALFTLTQASAEAGAVDPGTRPNFATPAGALFTLAQASADAGEVYPGTRPNFAAPAGALFGFAPTGVT